MAFTLLQVQNLRVTTEGGTIFLAWDPLPAPELKGYNIYYGTVSGQYIQRRTITPEMSSLAIRGLPEGTRYYAAVRAINAADQESAFSQEVAVTTADPSSATALLIPGMVPEVPLKERVIKGKVVPGATGMPSSLALLIGASAIIGMIFAWKRQLAVRPAHSHE